MRHAVDYVLVNSSDPDTHELSDICRERAEQGFALVQVSPNNGDAGVTVGLWLFFRRVSPPTDVDKLESLDGFETGINPGLVQEVKMATQGFRTETPSVWQELRGKKGLGASLTITGLVSLLSGIVLHFALRSDLIDTAMHLGYFFGLVGLFLFLIGLVIVF